MQYSRARWYDASTGRWLSQDPIGFAAGDANLYRYVGNGSTNYRDPSGLKKSVYESQGIWPARLTWVLDDEELRVIRELELRKADLLTQMQFIRDSIHQLNEDGIGCDVISDELEELQAAIDAVDAYVNAIKTWVPNAVRPANGVTITFPFDEHENGIPEWRRHLRIFGEGFSQGFQQGVSEGAAQLGRGFRQYKHYKKLWDSKNKSFTPNQTKCLDDFFKGRGRSPDLTDDVLRKYRELTRAAQILGKDTVGMQQLREKLINDVLRERWYQQLVEQLRLRQLLKLHKSVSE